MKIYTEINYKWLDGQLVETDSKFFDYEGEVTHCSFGGGGGGGLSTFSGKVADTVTDVITDPVGTTTDIIGDTITTAGNSLEPAVGGAGNILDQTGAALEEGISTGTESIGMNEGVATTLTDFGDNLQEGITTGTDALINDGLENAVNVNLDKAHDYGKAVNDVVSDELGRWEDTAMGFATDLGEAMGIGGGGGPDVDVPDKIKSNAKDLKNKAKANLKVNKSKGRARKSLRIG